MINTIIFDLDGTLLNTLEDLADSVNYALVKSGFALRTLEEVRGFVGNGIGKLIERALPDGLKNTLYTQVFEDFKAHYSVHCQDKTKPYPGIIELLDELAGAGYRMAIVSNKMDNAVKKLSEEYFGGKIPVAIGECENIRRKPAPDTVYAALKELHVTDGQAVYVGDSEVDLKTAAAAGIPCISVDWGFRSKEQLIGAGANEDHIIHAPDELIPLLRILFPAE